MFKARYHPKAFLALKRNVRRGLNKRTSILYLLQKSPLTAKNLAHETGLNYESILHHLHLMEAESIVSRGDKKPYIWVLTGAGQQTLLAV